tara:strand:- start:214 stop:396 length:183 start_codon:yes stop_codon:yes gene_type:complete
MTEPTEEQIEKMHLWWSNVKWQGTFDTLYRKVWGDAQSSQLDYMEKAATRSLKRLGSKSV